MDALPKLSEAEGGIKCVNPGPELPAAEVDKEKELPEEPDEGQVSPTDDLTIMEERMASVELNACLISFSHLEAWRRPESFEAELVKEKLDHCVAEYEDMDYLELEYQVLIDFDPKL